MGRNDKSKLELSSQGHYRRGRQCQSCGGSSRVELPSRNGAEELDRIGVRDEDEEARAKWKRHAGGRGYGRSDRWSPVEGCGSSRTIGGAEHRIGSTVASCGNDAAVHAGVDRTARLRSSVKRARIESAAASVEHTRPLRRSSRIGEREGAAIGIGMADDILG